MTNDAMVKDPVCGMSIYEFQAVAKMDYQGSTYRFCSTMCHQKFKADPQKFLKPAPVAAAR